MAFRVADVRDLERRAGLNAGALGEGIASLVIWTTTPWTLPANEAVAVRDRGWTGLKDFEIVAKALENDMVLAGSADIDALA